MVDDCSLQQIELMYSLPGTAAIWLSDGLKEKILMEVPPPPARLLNTMTIPPPPTSSSPTTAISLSQPPPIDKRNNQYTRIPPMPHRPTPRWVEASSSEMLSPQAQRHIQRPKKHVKFDHPGVITWCWRTWLLQWLGIVMLGSLHVICSNYIVVGVHLWHRDELLKNTCVANVHMVVCSCSIWAYVSWFC